MDQVTEGQLSPHGQPPVEYDDEIDLMAYVLTLWRRKWLVLAGACLCGAAAFGLGMFSTPTYEATVRLVVALPKTSQVGEITPTVTVASFKALVENQSIAAKIISEFGLGKPPLNMTPSGFLRSRLTVETVRDTNVVVIRVRMSDPDLAAKVANRFGQLSVDLAQQLSQDETLRARDTIKAQLDVSRKRLEDAETRLEQFRREAQIEALRKDVDTVLGQRAGLLPLLVEIQAEKARLAQAEGLLTLRNRIDTDTEQAKLTEAEAQLSKRQRVDTLTRSIETDTAALEASRKAGASGADLLGLQLKYQFVNPVYENLDQVAATSRTRLAELAKLKEENLDQLVAASRTRLAALEKQRAELIDVRRLDSTQLAQLNLLYSRETELDRLQTEFGLAKQIYTDVSVRYEQARLQVAGRSAQLQVADAALAPDRPIGPKVIRNTALALAVGLMLSAIGVLFLDAFSAAAARVRA